MQFNTPITQDVNLIPSTHIIEAFTVYARDDYVALTRTILGAIYVIFFCWSTDDNRRHIPDAELTSSQSCHAPSKSDPE